MAGARGAGRVTAALQTKNTARISSVTLAKQAKLCKSRKSYQSQLFGSTSTCCTRVCTWCRQRVVGGREAAECCTTAEPEAQEPAHELCDRPCLLPGRIQSTRKTRTAASHRMTPTQRCTTAESRGVVRLLVLQCGTLWRSRVVVDFFRSRSSFRKLARSAGVMRGLVDIGEWQF